MLYVFVFQRVACCYGRSGLHASVVRVGRQQSVVVRVGVGGSLWGDACCVSVLLVVGKCVAYALVVATAFVGAIVERVCCWGHGAKNCHVALGAARAVATRHKICRHGCSMRNKKILILNHA